MYSTVESKRMCDYSCDDFGPYTDWSDEDLLLEYRLTANREHFEELVKRYEKSLFAYLCRYIGNAQDAEEVFQSTFLMVHLKCEQFEEGRKFRPWLYRIAVNLAIDGRRKNHKHSILSIDSEVDSNGDEISAFSQILAGNEPDPHEKSAENERVRQLHDALESLPEEYRKILYLVYFQELTYRDAAESLQIPFGTVKSRLHKAFKKLNQILKEREE